MQISDSGAALIKGDSPVSLAKAVKNDPELMGMKEAHLRDSVALARFFHWLDVEVAKVFLELIKNNFATSQICLLCRS